MFLCKQTTLYQNQGENNIKMFKLNYWNFIREETDEGVVFRNTKRYIDDQNRQIKGIYYIYSTNHVMLLL